MSVRAKNSRQVSNKITQSARGEDCTLRIVGVCNFNPETTVFAHLNGGGMGIKHHDIFGCYACRDCHDWLDGRVSGVGFRHHAQAEFLRAMVETQNKLLEKGLIKI